MIGEKIWRKYRGKQRGETLSTVFRRWSKRHRTVYTVEIWGKQGYRVTPVVFDGPVVSNVLQGHVVQSSADIGLLGRIGCRRGATAILVIPRTDAVIKWLRLPTTGERQIAQMIAYESDALAPWPPEERSTGYQVLRSGPDEYTRVLLVMIRRSLIAEHLRRLAELGIVPAHVDVSTLGLARLFSGAKEGGSLAIVSVGINGFEYLRLSGGEPAFSRATHSQDNLVGTLRETLDLDARRGNVRLSSLDLVVAADNDKTVQALPEVTGLGVQVKTIEGFSFKDLGDATRLAASDATCVGAALRARDELPTMNLLPPKAARRVAVSALVRKVRLLPLAALWFALAVFGLIHHYFSLAAQRAVEAETEIVRLKSEVGDLVAKNEQIKLLADERTRVSLPLEIVLELYERTPLNVAISQMRYDSRGTLVLQVEAPTYADAFSYVDVLAKSPLFQNIEVNYGSMPSGRDQGFVEFQLTGTVTLKGPR